MGSLGYLIMGERPVDYFKLVISGDFQVRPCKVNSLYAGLFVRGEHLKRRFLKSNKE